MVPLPDTAAPAEAVQTSPAHACSHPSADPSGTSVAFICDRAGVPQLWTAPVDDSRARLLDTGPDPVTDVSWSPDGQWIAYSTAPGGGEHTRVLCVRPDGTQRRAVAGADPGQSAHLGAWRRDGAGLAVTVAAGQADAPSYRGLAAFLLAPDGTDTPELLTVQEHASTLRVCDFTPDGSLALLRRGPRGHREAAVLDTSAGAVRCVLRAADGDPRIGRFFPDGRTMWLRSDAGREFAALTLVHLGEDGSCLRVATAAERGDADLELLHLDDEARQGVLVWNAGGRSRVEVVTPARKTGAVSRRRPVAVPHEVVTKATGSAAAGWLLAVSGALRRPGVHRAAPSAGTTARTPWSSRDQDVLPGGRAPTRPERITLQARDGLPLDGWYYPAALSGEGPRPCVLHLHGGPEWQERPVFDPLYQELSERGLGVFAPNVRGSSGFGRSFVDADLGERRFAAITDVADCAAHMVLLGLADPARLAVMGRSYGGYLALAALVWHPEVFRTGVAVCGISDFAGFFAGTEPWIAESAAVKYGHPEHDRDLLRRLSPMSRIGDLRVPFLAVHGEHDTNVPVGQSEQVVGAARKRGIAAELLLLREEGHEFLRAENRARYRRTAGEWLDRHLAPRSP
ncbi:prolyl oligopeptidase family serine peptidase [Yinghuangia sp. KLBMP8922]|uniref:Prolyl oligopeptidase family serine peptidase n=1 Tax=Yinghuangia soli TaxID=2908204 RepID=A0AA41U986_9ACTN|nr:prolyl oligopeptidase family serine peptidase [Yinghuangia soli]MCF2533624.1 prolyl oligopeptidase family serine peptidase [Yinghuangia soli]